MSTASPVEIGTSFKDTFGDFKMRSRKKKETAVFIFNSYRRNVPNFYVKWTDQKKWTDPIETCTTKKNEINTANKKLVIERSNPFSTNLRPVYDQITKSK